MSIAVVVAIVAIGLAAGLMIGCIGIGGVIIVPIMVNFLNWPIHSAIPAAMMTFLVSGAIGTMAFWRQRSVRWDLVMPMWLGVMPFALIGALVGHMAPSALLEGGIGVLAIASGTQALLNSQPHGDEHDGAGKEEPLFAIGAVTGFASALTGTGGPVVLVPILLWRGLPTLTVIGLSQAIQLPVSALATVGNALVGSLDIRLGALLAVGLAAGTAIGAKIAHALPRAILRRIAAIALIAVGAFVLLRLGMKLLA